MKLFEGEIGRRDFILGYVGFLLVAVVVAYLARNFGPAFNVAAFVFGFFGLFYILSLVIRRLRDLNRTAWWSLLILFPYVNVIFALVLAVVPGGLSSRRI